MNISHELMEEIFLKAYNGLASQGFVRSMALSQCSYRGSEGRKCAAGYLIPDELYDPNMEGQIFADVCEEFPNIPYADNPAAVRLICRLQRLHDGGDTPELMQAALKHYAEAIEITLPEEGE